ncbi:MAG TPA: response regulator transcription factor [Blastocatellia bacterium]|nr:response regulator transcription factor [Blastocatellia bacterium]
MSDGILVIMRRADAESLTQSLRAEGFVVEHETDGQPGVERALSENFALIILDASTGPDSGINGMESLRRIRHRSLAPVLMVSAELNDAERILALELGADDYLSKPYLPQELIARVRAILRRAGAGVSVYRHLYKAGDIELDKLKRTVSKGGVGIEMTAAEFDLLELFLKRAGQVVSREEIARLILGRPLNDNDRSVDMHVSNLRRKLGDGARNAGRIKAIRGVGYSFTIT